MAILCLVLYTIIDSRTEEYDGCQILRRRRRRIHKERQRTRFLTPPRSIPLSLRRISGPQIDEDEFLDDWRYKLVNSDNLLSSAFEPEELTEIDGYRMKL